MAYNKNTDYQKLINEALARGDMAAAAQYEKSRNAKIAGEGLGYNPTNLYAQYLPQTTPEATTPTATVTGGGISYENPYAKELDDVIARVTGQGRDTIAKQFLSEADRTMKDTLGQYSLRTGALPSTAAIAAASQAADYQKSQLGSQLLNLDQAAADLMLSAGNMAQNDYEIQINDALTRWQNLGYADEKVASILGVAVGTPTSSQSYQNWQMGAADKADAYEKAMTLLQLGQMPSADVLAAAGLTAEEAQGILTSFTTPSYSGGGSGAKSAKMIDQSTANDLASRYQQGGWDAIAADLAYLGAQGYDVDWLTQWIYNYYQPNQTPGYTGLPGYSGGGYAGGTGGGTSGSKINVISTK